MVPHPAPGAPARLDHNEHARLRAAAFRAVKIYPGPVGELIAKELLSWEEFGYRFGGSNLIQRLVDEIMRPSLTKD